MPDPQTSHSINRDQAILLFWVVEDITELPRELFSLMHYLRGYTGTGMSLVQALRSSYVVGEYMMYLLGNTLHIALWLLAAGWFYRCGPRIYRFFAAGTEPDSNYDTTKDCHPLTDGKAEQ